MATFRARARISEPAFISLFFPFAACPLPSLSRSILATTGKSGHLDLNTKEHHMQRIVLGLVTCFAIVVAGCSSSSTTGGGGATSPTPPGPSGGGGSKLVGKWEAPDGKGTIEFMADGKLVMAMGPITMNGTYKHEGDKLTTTLSIADPTGKGAAKDISDTMTVIKLTDTELTTKDAAGKEETMKKKK